MAALDDRLGLGLVRIVQVFPMLPTDFEGIAETLRGNKDCVRVAALDQRIGRGSGAMHQVRDIGDGDTGLVDGF
ncbi:hypothetical protein D3C71_2125630 [compost metagenome]